MVSIVPEMIVVTITDLRIVSEGDTEPPVDISINLLMAEEIGELVEVVEDQRVPVSKVSMDTFNLVKVLKVCNSKDLKVVIKTSVVDFVRSGLLGMDLIKGINWLSNEVVSRVIADGTVLGVLQNFQLDRVENVVGS